MGPGQTRGTGGAGGAASRVPRVVAIVGAAAAGGLAADACGIPAGALLGALAGAFVVNVAWPGPRLAKAFRTGGKALSGAVIGLSFSPAMLGLAVGLAPVVVLGVTALIVTGLAMSLILHRRFGWDLPTALYACTPGGLSELAATSEDVGANTQVVVAVHTVRVVAIVVLGPPALALISHLSGAAG
jgi:membrane AbrB-like protein